MNDLDLSIPKKAYQEMFGVEMTSQQEQMVIRLCYIHNCKPNDPLILIDTIYNGFLKSLIEIPEKIMPLFDALDKAINKNSAFQKLLLSEIDSKVNSIAQKIELAAENGARLASNEAAVALQHIEQTSYARLKINIDDLFILRTNELIISKDERSNAVIYTALFTFFAVILLTILCGLLWVRHEETVTAQKAASVVDVTYRGHRLRVDVGNRSVVELGR